MHKVTFLSARACLLQSSMVPSENRTKTWVRSAAAATTLSLRCLLCLVGMSQFQSVAFHLKIASFWALLDSKNA